MISADAIRQGLIDRGLPGHAAEGVLMNFQHESGLDPTINELNPLVPGSRGGFGLAQWTGPRRVALENYAAEHGVSPGDVNLQLDFLMHELQGPENRALNSLLAANNAGEAAAAFVRDFERPAAQHLERRTEQYLGGYEPEYANAPGYGVDPAGMMPVPQNVLTAPRLPDPAAGLWQGHDVRNFLTRRSYG